MGLNELKNRIEMRINIIEIGWEEISSPKILSLVKNAFVMRLLENWVWWLIFY